jgi:hypothetical protein
VTATVARTSQRLRFDWSADVGVPALIRAGGMAVQLAVLAWVNGPHGPSLVDRLTKWDGRFYIGIAESGYPDVTLAGPTGGLTRGAEYAFYPLYSGLVALVHAVLRLPTDTAALTVSALAGMAGACGVHLVAVELTGSRRTGYLAAALLGVLPMAVTFQIAYARRYCADRIRGAVLIARLVVARRRHGLRGRVDPAHGPAGRAGHPGRRTVALPPPSDPGPMGLGGRRDRRCANRGHCSGLRSGGVPATPPAGSTPKSVAETPVSTSGTRPGPSCTRRSPIRTFSWPRWCA